VHYLTSCVPKAISEVNISLSSQHTTVSRSVHTAGPSILLMPADLWQAIKAYKVNISKLGGTGADNLSTFPDNNIVSLSNIGLYARSDPEVTDPLFVKKKYPVSGRSLYEPNIAVPMFYNRFCSPHRSLEPQPYNQNTQNE